MSTADTLHDWFATTQGMYLLEREYEFFDHALSDLFGYNAVQLGLSQHEFLRSSRMPMRIVAGNRAGLNGKVANADEVSNGNGKYQAVRLITEELPFDTGSVDLVVMPHVLEFNEHPHHVLREVERILMPEGHVIIAGFNPRSLWGAWRRMGRPKGYPWNGHFISLPRMKDWLALLGFEVVAGRFACYAPPLNNPNWVRRFKFMEPAGDRWWAVCGGVYFLQAIKRQHGMRLVKPKWNEGLVGKLMPSAPKLNNRMPQKNGTDTQ